MQITCAAMKLHWPKLIAYLEDGRVRIDNNDSERVIKTFVIGRKNWLKKLAKKIGSKNWL